MYRTHTKYENWYIVKWASATIKTNEPKGTKTCNLSKYSGNNWYAILEKIKSSIYNIKRLYTEYKSLQNTKWLKQISMVNKSKLKIL